MKLRIVIAGVIIAAIIGIIWAGTHSVVAISSPNSADYRVTLVAANGSSKIYTGNNGSFRRIVGNGTYTVIVSGNDQDNYFKVVEAKRFLRTAHVEPTLKGQSRRSFVGQNPGPCMTYLGGRLLSGACEDSAYDINEHVPATADLATYTQRLATNDLYGYYKGLVTTTSGQNVMLQFDIEGVAGYKLQAVASDLRAASDRYTVPVRNTDDEYNIKAFKDGFVVYDTGYTDFLYYTNAQATPTKLSLKQSEKEDFNAYKTVVNNDAITVTYNKLSADVDESEHNDSAPSGGSEVLVYKSADNQTMYSFKQTFTSATACGTDHLCAIDASGLSVYNISTGTASHDFSLPKVTDIYQTAVATLAFTGNRLYNVNVNDGSGSVDYVFDKYQFCGFQAAGSNYILCVFNDKSEKSALYFDMSKTDTDNIDQKILTIRNTPGVSAVTPYGTYIYVVPDYGDPVYDSTQRLYLPDPAKVKSADAAVTSAISKSGIDRSVYTIINTGTQ